MVDFDERLKKVNMLWKMRKKANNLTFVGVFLFFLGFLCIKINEKLLTIISFSGASICIIIDIVITIIHWRCPFCHTHFGWGRFAAIRYNQTHCPYCGEKVKLY